MMKKLLITGASGFLGQNICKILRDEYKISGTYFNNKISIDDIEKIYVNLNNRHELLKLINTVKPDIIIHTAAMSDPNSCEVDPMKSFEINVALTEQLAEISNKENITFVSISTDLVFNGENAPYTEDINEKAICEYGIQKKLSEILTLKENPNAIICRVPPMYGIAYGKSKCFLTGMLENLNANKQISLFTDEYRSFEYVENIIKGINLLIQKNRKGIFHIAGFESLSRYEFGEILCDVFGFSKKLLIKSQQSDVTMAARRAKNVCLNIDKAISCGYSSNNTKIKLYALKKAIINKNTINGN